jgi:hypothetical protein
MIVQTAQMKSPPKYRGRFHFDWMDRVLSTLNHLMTFGMRLARYPRET